MFFLGWKGATVRGEKSQTQWFPSKNQEKTLDEIWVRNRAEVFSAPEWSLPSAASVKTYERTKMGHWTTTSFKNGLKRRTPYETDSCIDSTKSRNFQNHLFYSRHVEACNLSQRLYPGPSNNHASHYGTKLDQFKSPGQGLQFLGMFCCGEHVVGTRHRNDCRISRQVSQLQAKSPFCLVKPDNQFSHLSS